ncbi:MAG: toll/interleukin-1 receptor domain-containing protein, partial [Desulfosarcina sp.]|nr:toll/interleukin-1 receptor domain-containing protein [Desulfobacterales bacterium]
MTQSYDAFLSYSHDDRRIAERISRRLRTYRPPHASGLSRRLRVFRDVELMTTAASLPDELVEQISKANQLILLASPSAKSEYINLEVETFLEQKGIGQLRIVLLRGELEESLPAALQNLPVEPLFIDLRGADRKRFRLETLRLLAA